MRINRVNLFNIPKQAKSIKPSVVKNSSASDVFVRNNSLNFARRNDPTDIKWEWYEGQYMTYRRYPEVRTVRAAVLNEPRELAKDLCLFDDDDIRRFTAYYQKYIFGFRSEKPQYSSDTYARLEPYIEEERQEVAYCTQLVKEIENKKLDNLIDTSKYKNLISVKLLKPIELANRNNTEPEIPNGIFLYGSSERHKKDIYNWLVKKTGLHYKSVTYDPINPDESISELYKALEEAQKIYDATKVRTLLELKNYDELLTNYDTQDAKRLIALFKNVAEYAGKDYKTTLLLNTEKPVEDFEPASIGAQRFGISIHLDKPVVTEQEEGRLSYAENQLRRYRARAREAVDKYTYVEATDDYDLGYYSLID